MKMWPRRRACGSHRANHRTLLNAVPLFDLQFVQVEIVRFKLLAMLDEYISAIGSRVCLLYTSPSPRDTERSRMPSSA